MSEPSKLPDSQRSEADATVDPLAETRMAPAEKHTAPLKSPASAPTVPVKPPPPPADQLSETYALPAAPTSLPEISAREGQTLTPSTDTPPDALGETHIAPSRFQQHSAGPTAPTRLAPPSRASEPANPSETIAHVSQAPDAGDPAYKDTRVIERPSGTDVIGQDSGIPVTLVVDSTKQPPVNLATHDTPIIPTPGFSSIRSIPGMPQHVGDFEILGVLGRGGMGVVYKAKQKQLKRIVALKMILGGVHASDEDLRRFRQEAEASARLQHPNIVQIHEVGEMDGKPYFSLEFVDGGSLSGKMANEPQPAFPAAQLIEILARAMHYAHQRGIVHRDLKPANILLANAPLDGSSTAPVTAFGIPKITDFGLAKRMDVDLGQTQSGAILGTPSYMAPEQAGGRIREIGPCTDIYALGAILYDLLTGRPPFKANTLADTLQQVQMVEPVSPGRLQPQVPRDLATICLKCLNKEPKKRYETSLALAEDLGRFLAGEPIQARPASLLERSIKWSKRRPTAAALIGVSVLSFVALGAGGWYSAASLYYKNLEISEKNQKILEANDLANNERVRAEDNLESALGALDGVMTELSVNLDEVPQMEKPRLKILNNALLLFGHLHTEDKKTPNARFKSARAKERLGEVEMLLDKLTPAETAYKDAEAEFLELVALSPKHPEYRAELARTCHDEGLLFRKKGLQSEAADAFRESIRQRDELVKEFPEDPIYLKDLAQSTYWLGTCLVRIKGKQVEAEKMYEAAIGMQKKLLTLKSDRRDASDLRRDFERDQARMLNNLGLLQGVTGRKAEAIKTFNLAGGIQKRLAAEFPEIPTIRREQARSLHNLAFQQWDTQGQRVTAEETFGKAIDLLEVLVREFPSVPAYRDELASFYRTRGGLFEDADRMSVAEQAYRKALDIHLELVKDFPKLPEYRLKLSDDYRSVGRLYWEDHHSLTCEELFAKALELQQELSAQFPGTCEYHSSLAQTLKNLATRIDLRRNPDSPDFFGMRGTAMLLSVGSISSLPGREGVPPLGSGLALASTVLANSLLSAEFVRQRTLHQVLDLATKAVREMKKALEIEPRHVDYLPMLHAALMDLAKAELEFRAHAKVAKVAQELVELDRNTVSTRLESAELLVRAMMFVRGDPKLAKEAAKEIEQQYATDALKNLSEARRISLERQRDLDFQKEFDLKLSWWRDVLVRPDFKKELIDPAKPGID